MSASSSRRCCTKGSHKCRWTGPLLWHRTPRVPRISLPFHVLPFCSCPKWHPRHPNPTPRLAAISRSWSFLPRLPAFSSNSNYDFSSLLSTFIFLPFYISYLLTVTAQKWFYKSPYLTSDFPEATPDSVWEVSIPIMSKETPWGTRGWGGGGVIFAT